MGNLKSGKFGVLDPATSKVKNITLFPIDANLLLFINEKMAIQTQRVPSINIVINYWEKEFQKSSYLEPENSTKHAAEQN